MPYAKQRQYMPNNANVFHTFYNHLPSLRFFNDIQKGIENPLNMMLYYPVSNMLFDCV